MVEDNSERIARLKEGMSNRPSVEPTGENLAGAPQKKTLADKLKGGFETLKKESSEHLGPYLKIGAVALGLGVAWLSYDYLTKRQNVAERNVTYRTSHTVYVAGNKEKKAAEKADRESITQVQEGGGVESKVGTFITETIRETRGDIEYYKMFNTQQRRIAATDQKPERFQAGLSIGGSINFKEQFAELIVDEDGTSTKGANKYMVYKHDPERGTRQVDIDVVEFPTDGTLGPNELGIIETDHRGKLDKRVMVNRLAEKRGVFGFLFGDFYREGTLLEDFLETPENKVLADEFFKTVKAINSSSSVNEKVREKLANKMVDLTSQMKKQPIYSTFEDGVLKILPQESTIYLGEDPSNLQRFSQWLGVNRDKSNILRVENEWDLFPGSWPIIKSFKLGKGKDANYLFDKYNNGGYSLEDKFGEIARIEIRDFFLSYGSDVIYSYYLDLNGNGKIDKKKELIGKVLCKPTHDEIVELEKLARGIKPETDLTLTANYSFMAPSESDMKTSQQYFKYGAYMESLMPDQIHRGFGQHSVLGFINDQRSDIMLFNDLNVGNLSRALTQESTLVARYDIVKLLNATKRPYAKDLAQKYGIESEFKGQFVENNPLLKKQIYLGPWPYILGAAGAIAAYKVRRNRKKE